MISEKSILFPHLHVTFENVGQSLNVFGFSIAFYGMIIALGMLLAGAFILWEARRLGYSEDDYLDMIIAGIICGVIGARVYYVIFAWDRYQDDILSVFNIRQGGLAIYGGIIGGLVAVVITCRRKGISFFKAADVLIFGVLIGQIMGRFGNFFNREAFGGYTDGLFTTPDGQDILVRQIAGALARRIVTYAKDGEECYIDEHMGFIKLGSRVDVYLPLTAKACVTMNQPTTGDQTVIAKLA